jgi:hypothetical protein
MGLHHQPWLRVEVFLFLLKQSHTFLPEAFGASAFSAKFSDPAELLEKALLSGLWLSGHEPSCLQW